MTRIDRMEQLLDSLRQQLLARTEARNSGTINASQAKADQSPQSQGMTVDQLKERLARELGSLDLTTPAGRRRARLSFVETAITWELGDSIVRDPQLESLLQGIEAAMNEDSQIGASLDELLAALAQGAKT